MTTMVPIWVVTILVILSAVLGMIAGGLLFTDEIFKDGNVDGLLVIKTEDGVVSWQIDLMDDDLSKIAEKRVMMLRVCKWDEKNEIPVPVGGKEKKWRKKKRT